MGIRGWVYVITNRSMPDLVKIGYSTKDPVLRAQELGSTGVPYEYEVAFDALVVEPRGVEQQVHSRLSDYRAGKEWFRCAVERASAEIRSVATEIFLERSYGSGIEPAPSTEPHSIAPQSVNFSDVEPAPVSEPLNRSAEAQRTHTSKTVSLGECTHCRKNATTTFAGKPYCAHHASWLRDGPYGSN